MKAESQIAIVLVLLFLIAVGVNWMAFEQHRTNISMATSPTITVSPDTGGGIQNEIQKKAPTQS